MSDDDITPRSSSHDSAGLSRRRVLQMGAVVAGVGIAEATMAGRAAASPPGRSPHSRPPRSETSFDDGWRFLRADADGAQAQGFDDSGWRRIDLPHDWSIEDLPYATSDDGDATADPSTMAFQTTPPPAGTPTVIGPFDQQNSAGGRGTGWTVSGVGWYRKHFYDPRSRGGDERVLVRFDGVFHNATVWLNGTQIASHAYGYTPFTLDVTPNLVAGENVLAVKVDNTVPDARWYSGSGIYRHTWLTLVPEVHVPTYGVFVTTPAVTRQRASVHVDVEATNSGTLPASIRARTSIIDSDGRRVALVISSPAVVAPGQTVTMAADGTVRNPDLWSPETPRRYTASTEIQRGAEVVDSVETSFGIRDLVWDGDLGLLINGTQVKVRGGCLHANYGPMGAVALGRGIERQVETLQAAGFNAIRTAHNPPDPYLLEVCDRRGMLVWDEAFDHWSGYAAQPDVVADLTTFIRRDRNHPSVIVWSTGNEVNDPTTGQQLHDVVHALDSSRPAVQGATPRETPDDPQYEYTDLTDVHYDRTDKVAIRAKYPHRPMTQSESWPATIYDDWKFAQDNAWFVGSWVWAAWDYMGESGAGATITATSPDNLPVFGTGPFPWFQDYQCDIDLIGQRKPQNYWRAVVYDHSALELFVERPAPAGTQQYANNWSYYDELQSWTWDVPAGQPMTVHAYTSGDSVTLLLNGLEVASTTVSEADRRVATLTVPYQPGELTAVARRDGRVVGVTSLTTTGDPAALRLTSDVRHVSTDRDDLAHVLVEVLDARGRLVPDAVTQVSFRVAGSGALVAVGNGNPHNIDSFQRPHRWTWHGQALAILRPARHPGAIRLTATSPGLRSDSVTVPVQNAGHHSWGP